MDNATLHCIFLLYPGGASESVMPMAVTTPSLSFFYSSIFSKSRGFTSSAPSSFSPTPTRSSCSTSLSISVVRSQMAQLEVFSFSGEKVGDTQLDLKSAPSDTARAVVHRGIVTDLRNRRRGTASTLTRGEVRGGGKKPFPQKKLGRARRGSQRTPLRPGGGVVFGPKPKDWSIKINRKEKRLAISTAIASAVQAADALVVEDEFGENFEDRPKTKDFIDALRRLGLDPSEKSTFLMMDVPDNVRLSGRNIRSVKMLTPRTLNLFDILDAKKLVFTKSAVDYLNSVYGAQAAGDEEEEEDVGNT